MSPLERARRWSSLLILAALAATALIWLSGGAAFTVFGAPVSFRDPTRFLFYTIIFVATRVALGSSDGTVHDLKSAMDCLHAEIERRRLLVVSAMTQQLGHSVMCFSSRARISASRHSSR